MSDATAYLPAIRAAWAWPNLPIARVEPLGEGQNNTLQLVNGELIFRFPKHAEAVRALADEAALLADLRGRLPIAIPDPLCLRIDAPVGEALMAYRRLPGVPLTQAALAEIGDEGMRARLAEQLASFLRVLHAVPLDAFAQPPRTVATASDWANLYARFRERLFPFMRADARSAVASAFEAHLSAYGGQDAHDTLPRTLVHGDFGTSNLLHDPATGALTGVLDWSSAGLGDPAVDLAALICPVGYGETFMRLGLSAYPELAAMFPRAAFYVSTFALQDALFGLECEDPAAFEAGIADYR